MINTIIRTINSMKDILGQLCFFWAYRSWTCLRTLYRWPVSSHRKLPLELRMAYKLKKILPILSSILLCATIFLLYLGLITGLPHQLIRVGLGDLDLVHCNLVQEGRNGFPTEPDGTWSIDSEHSVKSATIVQWHFGCDLFDSVHWHFSNTHSSQIVNDDPAFDLARNEHLLDDLFVDEDRCEDSGFYVFEVNKFDVKYEDWSEAKVSTDRIEKSRFLNNKNVTMSF